MSKKERKKGKGEENCAKTIKLHRGGAIPMESNKIEWSIQVSEIEMKR
jgi:hypothetical protein